MDGGDIRRRLRSAVTRGRLGPLYFRFVEWRNSRDAPKAPATDEHGVALPPPFLLYQVSAHTDWRSFLGTGDRDCRLFDGAAAAAGLPFSAARRVLDFGCGCGRIARHVARIAGPELFGVDYNPRLVGWCRRNLIGQYAVNRLAPPLDFPDGHFDVVYLFSVFTHLRRETLAQWLNEFARVLRPGGLALATFHDEDHASLSCVGVTREQLLRDGFLVYNDAGEGSNFMAAFQSRAFMAEAAQPHFDPVRIVSSTETGSEQALAVLRKR